MGTDRMPDASDLPDSYAWEGLPDMRFGGGLQLRYGEDDPLADDAPVFMGPVRDDKRQLDISAGLGRPDEGPREMQLREGTEEVVLVRGSTLAVPDVLRGTGLDENLWEEYRSAAQAEDSPLPEVDRTCSIASRVEVPAGMPTWGFQGGYETGYTFQAPSKPEGRWSTELMNDLALGIDAEMVLDGEFTPYDLEHDVTDDGIVYFDRPTYLLDPVGDEAHLFRGGDHVYDGDVAGMVKFLAAEYGWDMPETPARVKVQARLAAYGDDLGPQTRDVLLP